MLKYKLEVNDEARKTIIDLAMETKESTRRRKKVFIYFIVFGLLFIAIGAAKLIWICQTESSKFQTSC